MTLSRSRIAAAALFAVGVAEVVIAVGCGFASGLSWLELNNLLVMSNATIGLTLSTAGWPIAARRPRNPIGWLLLAGGISYASTAAGIAALACVPAADRADLWWRLVATVTNTGWTWALTLFLPLSLMLFPDGRLPSKHWRPLLILPAVGAPILGALGLLSDFSLSVGVSGYGANHAFQYGLPGAIVTAVAATAIVLSYVGALACLLVRFRHGTEQVRRQLLWVLLTLMLVVTTFVLEPLLPDSTFILLTIALVPVAIGVAVLRHQLLDIRVVFSRSLLYLLLTAGVIAVYLIVVAVLDQVVRSQVALGSSVLATLLVVVAFNPLRVWVQRLVNRAVYGAREDPVRAMAAVGARLREVGDQHGDGLVEVLASLCQVMRFPYGTITVQGREVASVGRAEPPAPDTTSSVHVTHLTWGEESLGELVVGLRPGETKVAAADRQVLDLLAGPIAVAVRAGLLSAELSRSREQVITAREEERRRLRRDLHDGLGPVLTGVVFNAEAALRLVEADPQRSAELITALRDQTSGALTDIRRLVYDLRPPALDSLGLVGALEEYAMLLTRRADGQPLAVIVRATITIPELPAAVEVAAYRIVAEALTNVTRHSSATSASVTVAVDDSALVVAVHDDGVNVGGGWQPGVGLTSIRERAAELGGQCTIATDRTGGRVDVRLPIPAVPESVQSPATARTGDVAP
jgi:two-component system NarL family sensor kinase